MFFFVKAVFFSGADSLEINAVRSFFSISFLHPNLFIQKRFPVHQTPMKETHQKDGINYKTPERWSENTKTRKKTQAPNKTQERMW